MSKNYKINIRKPVSIREKVYKKVRNNILNGKIQAGERLVEAKIAKEIKTSRTPVREALHMLEREGYIEAIPRVGYQIRQIDRKEMEELCEIRIVNESLAAQWAIDRITPKKIEILERAIATAEKELEDGKIENFVNSDSEFHEVLSKASGSKRLFELCQFLRQHMLRYRFKTLNTRETLMEAIKGHRAILEKIKAKDKAGVADAMRDHLEWVQKDIFNKVFDTKP